MVKLAFDTNVIVDLLRGRNRVVRRRFVEACESEQGLAVSLIVWLELLYGCERSLDPDFERASVQELLEPISIEALDEGDIVHAARMRAYLHKMGRPIGPYDLLIAGQALARDWTLVTANTREFSRIEGLKVIDWSTP